MFRRSVPKKRQWTKNMNARKWHGCRCDYCMNKLFRDETKGQLSFQEQLDELKQKSPNL